MEITAEETPIGWTDQQATTVVTWRQLVWRRFRRHKMAMFGAIMLILLIGYCFGGSLFISEESRSAIALVQIAINHSYFLHTLFQEHHGSKDYIIEVTETLCVVREGMVKTTANMIAPIVLPRQLRRLKRTSAADNLRIDYCFVHWHLRSIGPLCNTCV